MNAPRLPDKLLLDSVPTSSVAIPPHRVDGWGIPLKRVELKRFPLKGKSNSNQLDGDPLADVYILARG